MGSSNWEEIKALVDFAGTPTQRLCRLMIRAYQGQNGTGWPSYATLARKLGLNRRQTIYAVKSLVERGLIVKCPGPTRANAYMVQLSAPSAALMVQLSAPRGAAECTIDGAAECTLRKQLKKAGKKALTEAPVKTKKTKTESTAKKSAPRKRNPIWDTVVELFNYKPETLTKGDKSRIGAVVRDLKIKQATPDEMRARFKRMKAAWDKPFGPNALANRWDQFAGEPVLKRRPLG